MPSREDIPQFKTLEEEKAYWESKGPLGIETQREEIRETLESWDGGDCLYQDIECANRKKDPLTKQLWCKSADGSYACLMQRFTEIGVVIKVDRELPDEIDTDEKCCYANVELLLKAGYTAWVPLLGAPQ